MPYKDIEKRRYYDKIYKRSYRLENKKTVNNISKKSYNKNKEKILKQKKSYYENNKKYLKEYKRNYYLKIKEKFPFIGSFRGAKQRCENPNCKDFARYGGKGIKFELTLQQCSKLWERDEGWLLHKPSLDRKNPKGSYSFTNCRFIELSKNASLAQKRKQFLIKKYIPNY